MSGRKAPLTGGQHRALGIAFVSFGQTIFQRSDGQYMASDGRLVKPKVVEGLARRGLMRIVEANGVKGALLTAAGRRVRTPAQQEEGER